ncbi:uncharacterized protein CFP56_023490 [Quercus suber]|uniref:CCHC-type domain-containing protein n=1 Tax=Quercus suber TaxID=58331 RepID=A0AAW0K8I2_QUESU
MDSEFVQKLKNITLTEEEGEVIRVGTVHRDRILEECSLSLVGRFLTNKSFNQRAAKTVLRSVWKMGSDVRIVDVGDGVFQFKFSMESQLKWVLANGPWSFEDHPLVLCRWERGMTATSVQFNSIPMWVQMWGLPFDLLSEEVGRDIGNGLGTVVEVDLKAFSSDQARFLRVRVELPLEKPLRRGGVVASPEGDKICIGFKYERLVGLCFKCGRIGHEARVCSFHVDHQQGLPYGEWLKAGSRKTYATANSGGSFERREIGAQEGPSHGFSSRQIERDKVHSVIDNVGMVLEQNRLVEDGGSVMPSKGGAEIRFPSKGGAVNGEPLKGGSKFGLGTKVGTVALTAGKLSPDFEEIISELDQAIQSEPIILHSKSIQEEQLKDKKDIYSGLVDVEVMDEDVTSCKNVLKGKKVDPGSNSCLQDDGVRFKIGKSNGQVCSNPVKGRPKRSGIKNKSGLLPLQGPMSSEFDDVMFKKPNSKEIKSDIIEGAGLKKGTWKRALNLSSSVPVSIDAVIMGIGKASLEFNNVGFSHVKRNANIPAHLLAKYAMGIVDQCLWMEYCPDFIELAILHDVNDIVV